MSNKKAAKKTNKKVTKVAKTKGKANFVMPKGLKGQEAVKKKIVELTTALIRKSEGKKAAPAKKADITAMAKAVENKTKVAPVKNGKIPLAQQPEQLALRKHHHAAFSGVVYALLESAKGTLSVNEIMARAGIDRENRPYVSSLLSKLVEAGKVTTEQRECSVSGRTVRCVMLKKEKAS